MMIRASSTSLVKLVLVRRASSMSSVRLVIVVCRVRIEPERRNGANAMMERASSRTSNTVGPAD